MNMDHLSFSCRLRAVAARCRRACVLIAWICVSSTAQAANALKEYNVDPGTVAVTGASAGGFMAAQLGIAYSSLFPVGFAVHAGGPYDCARNNQWDRYCAYNEGRRPDIERAVANMRAWSGKEIDDVANMARQRIYIAHGTHDRTVAFESGEQLYNQVLNFVPSSNVMFDVCEGGTHFIGCDDQSWWWLWLYPDLRYPADDSIYDGQLLEIDQRPFIDWNIGMGSSGFLYVPNSCANGEQCKLIVSLHAAGSSYYQVGIGVVESDKPSGWAVADENNFLILYPQIARDPSWDWTGYYGSNYDQKEGGQLKAIAQMVRRITAGFQPASPSDCLFNWAEGNYPSLFFPPSADSKTLPPYYYRYYAATDSYVGTSSSDDKVYYLGPASNGQVLNVGALADWLSVSGCE